MIGLALVQTVVIPSDLKQARAVAEEVLAKAQRLGYSEQSIFALKLAMEEALINAIKHGNSNDPSKSVRVVYCIDAARASIRVRDEGPGFQPEQVPDPTAAENLERPSGRGIMLMRAFMDEVEFNEVGNEVHMIKLNNGK